MLNNSTMEQKRLLTIGNAPLCTLFFRCATQRMSVMLQNDDVKSVSIFWSFMQEIMNEWPWELFPAQPLTNSQTAATGTNNKLMSCILSCWMDDHTNILWANVPYSNVSLQVTKLTCWSVAAHWTPFKCLGQCWCNTLFGYVVSHSPAGAQPASCCQSKADTETLQPAISDISLFKKILLIINLLTINLK